MKVTRGDAWVSTRLVDGAGTGTPSGSSITYADALPGVAVTYRASEGAVGEDLHLDGADAPSRYVFDVAASAGVRAETQPNGTIALTDADGSRVLSLSPSFAFADRDPDVTQKVTTTLSELAGGGWRVVLSVDEKWLRQALADGPVTIDPTVELQGASRDCALTSDTPTLSFCSNSQLWVGWSGDHDHHSLVKWDVTAIPKDALVLSGDAGLYQSGSTVSVAKALTLHRVTRDWTNGASWNTYDGTHAWTTAGGDYDSTPAASQNDPAYNNGWIDWYPTALVQRWVDGSLPNYGVLVKDQSPHVIGEEDFLATEGTTAASAPELDIIWTTRGGAPDPYTFESQGIDAKTTAAVNAANGNLQLTTKDLAIAGQGGLNLAFSHSYNSIADPTIIQGVGLQTTGSLGRDVSLQPLYGPDVVFSRGDGLQVAFSNPQTTGTTKTFTTPADLSGARLTQSTTTNIYTLDLPKGLPAWSGLHQVLTFSSGGALTQLADTQGHHLNFTYDTGGYTNPPALDGITDTNNAYYDVDRASPTGNESVDNIATPSDTQHWTFTYDSVFGTLTKATSIDDTNYQYAYDSARRLTKITGPTGAVTLITYNGTTPKVASIIQTTNTAHTTGPTTTFTYSTPTTPCQSTNFDYQKTVVQRPNSTSTTYCSNDHAQITYDTDNPTAATPSGEWYDLHDQYTQGTGTHSITISGTDAGAGVKKLSLERGSGIAIASTTLPCDPRNAVNPTACPHTATRTASFDLSAIPEGAQAVHARTTDYAGRTTVSPDWVVNIDRTGPVFGSDFMVTAGLDSAGEAIVRWDAADDPALADGTMPSGMANYLFRSLHTGGSWSAWATTTTESGTVPGSHAGESIALEIVHGRVPRRHVHGLLAVHHQRRTLRPRQRQGTWVPSDRCDVGVHRSTSIEEEPVHQGNDGRQVPLRHRLRRSPRAVALGTAVGAAVLLGCGSGDAPARSTSKTTATTKAPRPQLYAVPVVVKIGTTFEVRVRFKRALPLSKNNGVRAEFSIGPSTTDHDPVKMKGSTGFCYRQTLYNDLDRDSLKRLHAGSRATLEIVVHGQPPTIVRRVTLASDVNAVPSGCKLSPNPGPG